VESGCFVCEKHLGRIDVPGGAVHQDELVYVSHGVIPDGKRTAYLGTLFVEPRRHVAGVAELTDEEAKRIGVVSSHLARALKDSEKAEHVYVFVLGHHVSHLHVWLYPVIREHRPSTGRCASRNGPRRRGAVANRSPRSAGE